MRYWVGVLWSVAVLWGAPGHPSKIADIYLSNVNALVILTSQDMLTSGEYSFAGGIHTRIYNFPADYHFDPFWRDINFFINGSLGYSKAEQDVHVGEGLPNDYTRFDTVAARFGGGIRLKTEGHFEMALGADVILSYLQNRYDYNSPESELIFKPIIEGVFANKRQNAFTYEIFWRMGYYPQWFEWKPYAEVAFEYFDTKTDFNAESFSHFTSRSGGSRLRMGVETPQFVHAYGSGLSAEIYTQGNVFTGDVRDTLGFDSYGSVAYLLHLYLPPKALPLLQRIDLMIESLDGDGIHAIVCRALSRCGDRLG